MSDKLPHTRNIEWPTALLIAGTYALWLVVLYWVAAISVVAALLFCGVLIAFHASLTHEVLHGHPFPSRFWSEMTMRLPLNLAIPYCRFRDTHLAHHSDPILTDPYDDPESNFLDPAVWTALPRWKQRFLTFNNTLAGRILVGPALTQWAFMKSDLRLWRAGEKGIATAWILHAVGAALVIAIVLPSAMPFWAYLVACYMGLGLLRIRTFLEHRAHEKARGRTVIVEDRGPLAWLYLFNSLHAVHHMHPSVPWYRLRGLYENGKERFIQMNDGYVFRSYGEIFRGYFWRTKDPVEHPLWQRR